MKRILLTLLFGILGFSLILTGVFLNKKTVEAAAQHTIKVLNESNTWDTYELAEGVVLPEGLSYDHRYGKYNEGALVLENYTGKSIQVLEGGFFKISVVVRGVNTLTGGSFATGTPDADINSMAFYFKRLYN